MSIVPARLRAARCRIEIRLLVPVTDRTERRLERAFDGLVDAEAAGRTNGGSTLSWRNLVAAEPKLAALEAEVRAVVPADERFCANAAWFGYDGWPGLKPRYVQLVGWERGAPGPDYSRSDLACVGLDDFLDELDEWEPDRQRRMAEDEAAGRGFLWSEQAYEVGYKHLYELLPACRICGCL